MEQAQARPYEAVKLNLIHAALKKYLKHEVALYQKVCQCDFEKGKPDALKNRNIRRAIQHKLLALVPVERNLRKTLESSTNFKLAPYRLAKALYFTVAQVKYTGTALSQIPRDDAIWELPVDYDFFLTYLKHGPGSPNLIPVFADKNGTTLGSLCFMQGAEPVLETKDAQLDAILDKVHAYLSAEEFAVLLKSIKS